MSFNGPPLGPLSPPHTHLQRLQVLYEMGEPYKSSVELLSFHTVSKVCHCLVTCTHTHATHTMHAVVQPRFHPSILNNFLAASLVRPQRRLCLVDQILSLD